MTHIEELKALVKSGRKCPKGKWDKSEQKGTKGHCYASQIWHPKTK